VTLCAAPVRFPEQDFDDTITDFVGPNGLAGLMVAHDRVASF
jgi:hypothetical protein